ncbi:MAG: hypothetical protein HYU35_03055 [Parcubacteria group bacterium]|nr:hypothetical protein [Parcubacteria group bacterium]
MKQQGFFQLIVIVLIFIIILSLFGVSLTSLFNNKTIRENFSVLWNGISYIWNTFLSAPVRILGRLIFDSIKEPLLRALSPN